jgi:hypothetical protein
MAVSGSSVSQFGGPLVTTSLPALPARRRQPGPTAPDARVRRSRPVLPAFPSRLPTTGPVRAALPNGVQLETRRNRLMVGFSAFGPGMSMPAITDDLDNLAFLDGALMYSRENVLKRQYLGPRGTACAGTFPRSGAGAAGFRRCCRSPRAGRRGQGRKDPVVRVRRARSGGCPLGR